MQLPIVTAAAKRLAFPLATMLLPAWLAAQPAPPNGPGNALRFDGVNDHLTAAPVQLPTGNSSYTSEAWIKTTVMNSGPSVSWGNFGVNNQVHALRLTPRGRVNYWWGNDLTATTANLAGAWHHVAATFNGLTRRIYVDGVSI